jgi:hypothetical protein
MSEHEECRTLVKSPPELWSECSDAASLGRHLDGFGEIRITRLEPETAVAWEGEQVSGTVRLEPSGWGTKVILRAREADGGDPPPGGAEPQHHPATSPEPEPEAESSSAARAGLFSRLLGRFRPRPPADIEPEPVPAAPQRNERPPTAAEAPLTEQQAALRAALDSLGAAHRRPFSRG